MPHWYYLEMDVAKARKNIEKVAAAFEQVKDDESAELARETVALLDKLHRKVAARDKPLKGKR